MKELGHWVLIGPQGKQAGLKNQHEIALQLAAIYLSASGLGGGIIEALLPKTEKELDHLEKLTDRGYTIKKVAPRSNLAQEVRDAVMSDTLIAQLAVRFEREKGNNREAMHAVNRSFPVWVCEKLMAKEQNDVKTLIEKAHPELANRTSHDWWKKQLNQRVKKIKK